jgi:hypothetical protein
MTMPAGRYYIGDLCYVMHPEWSEACALFFPSNTDSRGVHGEFVLKDGRRFASFGTAFGDGEYYNNMGTSHCVDSGSIGCIRMEDIRDDEYSNLESLGAIVEFTEPFEVEKIGRGLLRFGHVEIETDPVYDEEY